MNQEFQKISILGGGVLGGSIALALQEKCNPSAATLWFRKAEAAIEAQKLGFSNVTADLSEAVRGADLVILAVPVGAMPSLLKAALTAGLPSTCLVTDVGSVKQAPHNTLAPILNKSGNAFIGSHPMAGSERNGIRAARKDLFRNAACLLTIDSETSDDSYTKLENFWMSIGCTTTRFTADAHDDMVAKISHLPHIIAAATAKIALKDPELGVFGGGGLRDTTRVAAGNPVMWAEIVTENREAIIPLLKETIDELRDILATLEKPDQELACTWLSGAKQLRDTLPKP
ncbi:MAG: prephenate dehydrogenase [Luteolibacter sp.]